VHNENGPARIIMVDNKIVNEQWYLNGKKHRVRDAAEIWYDSYERITAQR
jgi:hypothetical protein